MTDMSTELWRALASRWPQECVKEGVLEKLREQHGENLAYRHLVVSDLREPWTPSLLCSCNRLLYLSAMGPDVMHEEEKAEVAQLRSLFLKEGLSMEEFFERKELA